MLSSSLPYRNVEIFKTVKASSKEEGYEAGAHMIRLVETMRMQ